MAEEQEQPAPSADDPPAPRVRRPWRQERGRQLFFNMRDAFPRLMAVERVPRRVHGWDDAIVTQRTRNKPGSAATRDAPQLLTGAIYDRQRRLLPEFADAVERSRAGMNQQVDPPRLDAERASAAAELAGEHLYGGELTSHFGHFLMETMGRAWAFRDRPAGARILFHQDSPRLNLGTVARTVLGWLGVGEEDILLANKDYRVERLLVPNSQCEIQHSVSPGFHTVFRDVRAAALGDAPPPTPRRVYLSRRNIDRVKQAALDAKEIPERKRNRMIRKLVLNEAEAEELFRARGFAIVTPELMPLRDQIALWAGAEVVAGVTGSALHGALFAQRGRTRVVSLNNRLSANQVAIEEMMALPSAHIFCTSRGNAARSTELRLDVVARALDELGL